MQKCSLNIKGFTSMVIIKDKDNRKKQHDLIIHQFLQVAKAKGTRAYVYKWSRKTDHCGYQGSIPPTDKRSIIFKQTFTKQWGSTYWTCLKPCARTSIQTLLKWVYTKFLVQLHSVPCGYFFLTGRCIHSSITASCFDGKCDDRSLTLFTSARFSGLFLWWEGENLFTTFRVFI